ncbi:hypothetical protein DV515_00014571 [Chloebia gouldiae]|uniref:Uncharacterized protein n=1 Tax=Chloebia gouldiae TaxID=44316 RepID=A0A3L8RXR3_CHLGU|nr:hypothetical protein DV515_00014571 [Chloebia gouldiae]
MDTWRHTGKRGRSSLCPLLHRETEAQMPSGALCRAGGDTRSARRDAVTGANASSEARSCRETLSLVRV